VLQTIRMRKVLSPEELEAPAVGSGYSRGLSAF
jgi:hypothetical protein